MILIGIVCKNYFNFIDQSILDISSILRQIALIIIITKTGLTLNVEDLKKYVLPQF